MKKGDIAVLIFLILILAVSFFVTHTGYEAQNTKCVIKVDGEIYKEIKLNNNYNNFIEINSSFGYNKISIRGKTVEMTEADCSDSLCTNDGKISEPFESIVCLPHRLIVYIEGVTELDYVSY